MSTYGLTFKTPVFPNTIINENEANQPAATSILVPVACIPLHTPTLFLLPLSLAFSLLPTFLFTPPSHFVPVEVGG